MRALSLNELVVKLNQLLRQSRPTFKLATQVKTMTETTTMMGCSWTMQSLWEMQTVGRLVLAVGYKLYGF